MNLLIARPPIETPAATVLAAGHGGHAAVWIIGWIVVLAAVVALVVYLARRRQRRNLR